MKLKLKEDPGEWRKTALLSALGLALMSSVLRWRHVLSMKVWVSVLVTLGMVAVLACWQPRIFRGYYRVSGRIGFAISQFLGRVVLGIFFVLVLTPVAVVFRMMGKDLLKMKRQREAGTYWQPSKSPGPLDRMF